MVSTVYYINLVAINNITITTTNTITTIVNC